MLQLKNTRFSIWLGLWVMLVTGCVVNRQQPNQAGGLFRKAPQTPVSQPGTASPDSTKAMSVPTPADTTAPADTTLLKSGIKVVTPEELARADSIARDSLARQSDLQSTVEYTAQDSTIMDVDGKQVHLYGDAEVKYGTIQLKADYIRIDWTTNEIFAKGTYDSTTKKAVGEPIFQDGPETYNTRELRYNYKTKKGFIRGVVTQQGEGNIRGDKVKKDDEGNLYIRGSIYTTCNLADPHFYINAPKIKLIDNKQVVSGPFNLVIADVPLPVGLPFGFFPFPKKKEIGTSGIIFPTYGEEPNGRGLYLRDGGYYFAISEYFNATVTGQIYSTGSWGVGLSSVYTKRYRYNGNVALRFNQNRSGDEVDRLVSKIRNTKPRNDFSIIWSHAPVPRGNSTFSASVNVTSNSFNQFNAQDVQRYLSNTANSSVQYNRTFGQYARAGASLRVNQNFGQINDTTGRREGGKTDIATQFNFGINQIAPFALNGGRGRWYESFRLGMDFNGQYAVDNSLSAIDTSYTRLGFIIDNAIDTSRVGSEKVIPFEFANLPTLLRDAQFTGRYSVPISLPNFKLLRFINFTPSLSFQGEVFTENYTYKYLGNNRISIDTSKTLGTEYSYSFGAGLNTRFYGTFQIQGKRLEAIRHTVIPSISFSYTPDFSGENFGFYQKVRINDKGDERYLSRYRGLGNSISGLSSGRASGVISFGLNNSLEMKLRSRSDTAATQFEKVSLLDNLSIGGSYNLMADSLNLSNIAINAATRIGQNFNLNFNMTLDPYSYDKDKKNPTNTIGFRTKEFAISKGQGLANLQNLVFGLSTSFNPKKKTKETPKTTMPQTATEAQMEFIERNPDLYVDFNIPWNLSLNYNFGLSKIGLQNAQIIQTINATGDLSLTEKWKISLQTGFDFKALSPSITTVSLYRDLHCWDMSFNWTPFAGNRSRASNYSFTLKAKSSILQDLKLTRRRSFYDQGGF